ncbi:MAG TPA: preprotein translocase subunit SecE [Dehalococcoidia bacterium]
MTEQVDQGGPSAIDTAKLLLAVITLIAGIGGYYWFAELPNAVRLLMVLAGVALGAALLFWSAQGRTIWAFVQGSRVELRKMVWPTRQETLQTTLVVFVFVLIVGVFFWLVDMLLAWATRHLTGQGG